MSLHHQASEWHLWAEIRKVFHLTVYFGIWFSALTFLLHETEGRAGLPLEAWGFAWIKAAICAKFLLVGQLLIPMPRVSRASSMGLRPINPSEESPRKCQTSPRGKSRSVPLL